MGARAPGSFPRVYRLPHLLIHRPHQMARRHRPEGHVVHQAHEDFLITIHALYEQVFKLLAEYRLEVLDAIGHHGLSQLLVGHGGLAHLIEEELIGGGDGAPVDGAAHILVRLLGPVGKSGGVRLQLPG